MRSRTPETAPRGKWLGGGGAWRPKRSKAARTFRSDQGRLFVWLMAQATFFCKIDGPRVNGTSNQSKPVQCNFKQSKLKRHLRLIGFLWVPCPLCCVFLFSQGRSDALFGVRMTTMRTSCCEPNQWLRFRRLIVAHYTTWMANLVTCGKQAKITICVGNILTDIN